MLRNGMSFNLFRETFVHSPIRTFFDPIFRSSSHVHLTAREVEKKKRLNDVPDDEEEHDEELLSVSLLSSLEDA